MKYVIILFILFYLIGCSNDSRNYIHLENEVKLLDNRIEFINKSLQEVSNDFSNSRRHSFLLAESEKINIIFKEINYSFIEGDDIKEQQKKLERIIHYMCEFMDANDNSIDDLIQNKFQLHFEEIKRLNKEVNDMAKTEINYSVKLIQEGFLNTIFTLSRTDKYTFEKAEIVPYDRNRSGFKANTGDSLQVFLFPAAYDSTYIPKIIYWVDDSTKNKSNAIVHDGWNSIMFGGEKGEHTVYGKYFLYPNNREDYLDFRFSYTIE